jgi:hypothetical protein
MTLDVQLTLNTSLYTVAAIFSTVVLSPLLMAVIEMINPGFSSQSLSSKAFNHLWGESDAETQRFYSQANNSGWRKFIPKLFRLNRLVIVVSLAMGIVGGLDAFSTDPTNFPNGRLYLRVAAGMSLAALVIIWLALILLWPERQYMDIFHRKTYVVLAAWVVPWLTVRVAYTMGVALTIDTNRSQVFNPLTGSWILYLCVAWLPEIFCSISLVAVGLLWAGKSL